MRINPSILRQWEKRLAEEELSSLDQTEGFQELVRDKTSNITNLAKFIEEIEARYKIIIQLDKEELELKVKNREGREIGVIRPRSYSHGQIQIEDHLEKFLEDDYRGSGLGQAMYDVWVKANFPIPKREISREPANILFLLKNGYYLASRFDDSGLKIELTPQETLELNRSLRELSINGNFNLDFSYLLILR